MQTYLTYVGRGLPMDEIGGARHYAKQPRGRPHNGKVGCEFEKLKPQVPYLSLTSHLPQTESPGLQGTSLSFPPFRGSLYKRD